MNIIPHITIVGAGTLGMCTAACLSEQNAQVTVIDAQSIASGSSGRSVGVVGTQKHHPFDILLRAHSMKHFRRWEAFGLPFNHIGYLRLARTPEQMALFESSMKSRVEAGFSSQICQTQELQSLIPHLNTEGLEGGLFGPDDGFIDPYGMCNFLADMVRKRGGRILQFCKLLDSKHRNREYILETSKGEIRCDVVINAAGAWASSVAELLGQELSIFPERHEAVVIHLEKPLDYTMPMVMDLVNGEGTGLNLRHEKANELIAEIHASNNFSRPEDPDNYNDQCDEESKYTLAELILERFPKLPGAGLGYGWAGLYPITKDHWPIVGPIDTATPTIVTAAGAGGYGVQLAPVIGQITADWALYGSPVSAPETENLSPNGARETLPIH